MDNDKNINNESDDLFTELAQQDISDIILVRTDIDMESSNATDDIKENEQIISKDFNNNNVDETTKEQTDKNFENIEVDTTTEYIQEKNINIWAICSLVFGIASLIFWLLPYIGFATSIIGILLSAISKKYSNTSMSTISIIMCIVGIFISLLYSIFKVVIFII